MLKDDARIFRKAETSALKTRLHRLAKAKAIAIVVRTSAAPVRLPAVSVTLDTMFASEVAWQSLPPPGIRQRVTGWLFRKTVPDDAVEVILLTRPAFIGVRYGPRAEWRALRAGMLLGPQIAEVQQVALRGDIKRALDQWLSLAEKTLSTDEPWYERLIGDELRNGISGILDELMLSDWRFYNDYLLRPMVESQVFARRAIGASTLASLGAVLGTVLIVRGALSVTRRAMRRPPWLKGVHAFGIALPVELIVGAPAIGCFLLLSVGRLEDRLFAAALTGLPTIRDLPELPASLGAQTGWWWAIGLAVLYALANLTRHLWLLPLATLPSAVQADLYEGRGTVAQFIDIFVGGEYGTDDAPYAKLAFAALREAVSSAVKWTVLFSVLPFAAALYFCLRALAEAVVGAPGTVGGLWHTRKIASSVLHHSQERGAAAL